MQIERTAHAKRTKSTSQKTATQKAKPKKAASKPPVSKKTPRKSGVGKTIKDKTIMVASILCSVVLIAVMVFNAPIIAYKKIDANGTTVSNISIVKYQTVAAAGRIGRYFAKACCQQQRCTGLAQRLGFQFG